MEVDREKDQLKKLVKLLKDANEELAQAFRKAEEQRDTAIRLLEETIALIPRNNEQV